MPQPPVRYAILGFGLHAVRRLLPAFARSRESTLIGLWRRDAAAAARDAAQYRIPLCFPSAEDLCASPEVDVVFITSPDVLHREDCMLALAHGKAVLCEKPLAMNAAEARAIAEEAKRRGAVFGVGQNLRHNPSIEFLREQILAGRIGDPQLAHAQYSYPAQLSARKWIMDPGLAAGGPIGDVGVHCVDALRFLLEREVTSVSTLARRDGRSSSVEAIATMQLEMTGGVYASVTASGRSLYRSFLEVAGSDGVLVGENAMSVDRPVEVSLRRAGELVETFRFDNADGYVRMLDSFAAAFRREGVFPSSAEDGVLNMAVIDAAYRSWKSGIRERVATGI